MEESINQDFFEGWHILLYLEGCAASLLENKTFLEKTLVDAATQAGAQVVQSVFHQFNPQGLSGVVVIAESHVAVHTWPEHGHASIDIFTCGQSSVADRIADEVIRRFSAIRVKRKTLEELRANWELESEIDAGF